MTMCLCSNLYSSSPVMAFHSRAEKSALAVAACVAGAFRVAPHTHPLCPSNVPIQSPVSPLRIMGWPSVLTGTSVRFVRMRVGIDGETRRTARRERRRRRRLFRGKKFEPSF